LRSLNREEITKLLTDYLKKKNHEKLLGEDLV
jgi:hypothetical protein